jgi:hypothetical protein
MLKTGMLNPPINWLQRRKAEGLPGCNMAGRHQAMMRTRPGTGVWRTRPRVLVCVTAAALACARSALGAAVNPDAEATSARSQWVYFAPDGKLAYKTLKHGDRIMDFSSAGYMGGGVAIPLVPVKATVGPSGGDNTAAIQAALNAVSKMELVQGFRGAVLLEPGRYDCRGTLTINASGVVLRGSGSGTGGTTLRMTGSPHLCISIAAASHIEPTGPPARILDSYVPSGSTSISVDNALAFQTGNTVLISRPVTAAWIKFMGMEALVRSGRRETWLSERSRIETERVIQAVTGHTLTLDIPLSDSFDAQYLNPPGVVVEKCAISGRISQVGVESLHILAPAQVVEIRQSHHQAINLNDVTDAWLRDITIDETVSCVGIGSRAKRVSVERVNIRHTVATKGAAKPADFSAGGSQLLFDRCSATGNNLFYFVTGGRATGPNVLLNCVFQGDGHVQPHQRWATGLLVDGCRVPEGGIDFMNRGEMGSGHGWTIGWAVAWNCAARSYIIQQPPGSANWAIGCRGARAESPMPFGHQPNLPNGFFDSHGTPVLPASLYLAQLYERLGPQALKNIGY